MDMPLSLWKGAPSDLRIAEALRWDIEDADWSMNFEFNRAGHRNHIALSHCTDHGWIDLVQIDDADGAIALKVIDFDDDDPEILAAELVDALVTKSAIAVPDHVITIFRDAALDWILYWRKRAAQAHESQEV
jgi:hypothetical protein